MSGKKIMNPDLISIVTKTIDKQANFLKGIAQKIWENPELQFEEHFAHDFLVQALKSKGFTIEEHYKLPTAFKAAYSSKLPGPIIAFICEYDALPSIGHGVGHNLTTQASVGAGLAVKAALESDPTIGGKIIIFGTPAKEAGGGKVILMKYNAFDDIDIALAAQPHTHDFLTPPFIAFGECRVTFIGKETHASGAPWEGRNALDAAVASYNSISLMRQQMKPTSRVHGIISNGGSYPSVIPGKTEMQYFYLNSTLNDLQVLRMALENCFRSAAKATDCKVDIKYKEDLECAYFVHNKTMTNLYKKYATEMGIVFRDKESLPFVTSTDMGNVSQLIPSIQPRFSIDTDVNYNSYDFTEASKSENAQKPTLLASRCLALVTLEILTDPEVEKQIKKDFESSLEAMHKGDSD